ncbi:hypothetical protein F5Y05DRAFT_382425 [Hypoxylon sp. FL0543]|nr:hypothetical protein F5Y05DRAFT_382425 [Hypoxylon sp. FL0543]
MLFSAVSLLTSAAAVSAAALPSSLSKRGGSISVTPHAEYSSSIGVLGCKINTNRVAYWPSEPDCNNLCVKVSANGRTVHLLKIDHSGGAYDISYDAYNYLVTGKSATVDPIAGGGISATYENAPMSECADLLDDGKLPFTAANAAGFIYNCPADSWVGENYSAYNIANMVCTYGIDEPCTLPPLSEGNQPICEHQAGIQTPLANHTVWNIDYPTGKLVAAL